MQKDKLFKKFLLSLYAPVRALTVIMLTASVLYGLSGLFKQYFLKNIIDFGIDGSYSKLYLNIGLMLGFEVLGIIFTYVQNITRCIKIFRKQTPYVSEKSFMLATKNGYSFFADNHSGKICSAVNDITNGVFNLNKNLSTHFLVLIATMISNLILLAGINLIIFASAFVLFVSIIVIRIWFFSKKYNPLIRDAQSLEFEYNGMLNDALLNITSLKVYNSIKIFSENLKRKKKQANSNVVHAHKNEFTFGAIINIIYVSVFAGLIVFSISLLKKNNISIGSFVIFITSMIALKNATTSFSWSVIELNTLLIKLKNAHEIISSKNEDKDSHLPNINISSGSVEFKNVSFKYKKDYVFKDFSIKLQSGEKVGIIGVSGSGKTTFTNLLFKFYEPEKGKILVDSQNISEFSSDSLYESISYVPQETLLLHSTILENVKLARPQATENDVINSCKRAEIHDFIMSLEDGYNTIVGERGIKLSGGQRQRIALARIFLRNSKIIIFDEATSSLDNNTEFKVQENIIKSFKNQTLICIAHRLSSLKKMDRIVVIEKGKIIDEGSPKEIIPKYEKVNFNDEI